MEELLTVADVAAALKVTQHTVYMWVWSGELPHRRLGPTGRTVRFTSTDLQKYLEKTSSGN